MKEEDKTKSVGNDLTCDLKERGEDYSTAKWVPKLSKLTMSKHWKYTTQWLCCCLMAAVKLSKRMPMPKTSWERWKYA